MLGSFSGKVAKQINRQGYPERLANATQQAFLQVAKKKLHQKFLIMLIG
jgi:hypothetical protein